MTVEETNELLAEVALLRAEKVELQAAAAALRAENVELRQQVELLQARLATLEEQKGGPLPFVKANRPKREAKPRKKRAAEANRGRRRMAATRQEVHRIEVCPECGEGLKAGRCYYRREVIDIPLPQPVEVVAHEVQKGWCWRCRKWHAASVSWQGIVIGRSRVGVRLMGLVAYLRARLRLPLRTIQEYVRTVHQVRLSVGEISDLCRRAGRALGPGSAALLAKAQASPVVHMDETGWREDGRNGYIWCLATDEPQPVRYYHYDFSRSGDVAMGMLGGFAGHLVSDFYGAYNKYPGAHQRCWVHLLRDLKGLQQEYADQAAIVAWAAGVKWLYVAARDALTTTSSPAERSQLYDRLWRMAERFGLQYATLYDHPCCALAKRLLRHHDELFQFLLQPAVPADNNLAERALRPLVVQRKISGGSRSQSGSDTRMKLASLFETWQARHLNPLLECWSHLGFQPALPPLPP